MYNLGFKDDFWNSYKKLVKGNPTLLKKFKKALAILSQDPFYSSLKTHKVETKKYQNVYSSLITGDVRVIWKFDKEVKTILLILETGTHSGANQVYKNKSS